MQIKVHQKTEQNPQIISSLSRNNWENAPYVCSRQARVTRLSQWLLVVLVVELLGFLSPQTSVSEENKR
jgi:hypothetical protein